MAEVKQEGDMILVGDRVRIESGPPLVMAIATQELLSNTVTASHYAVGKRDAKGKKIALGEEFTYLDWGAAEDGGSEGKRVFYVSELVEISEEERSREGAETTETERWVERGVRATEDGAISLGQQIAGA